MCAIRGFVVYIGQKHRLDALESFVSLVSMPTHITQKKWNFFVLGDWMTNVLITQKKKKQQHNEQASDCRNLNESI